MYNPENFSDRENEMLSCIFSTLVALATDVLEFRTAGGAQEDYQVSNDAMNTVFGMNMDVICKVAEATRDQMMDEVTKGASVTVAFRQVAAAIQEAQAAEGDEDQLPQEMAQKLADLLNSQPANIDDDCPF